MSGLAAGLASIGDSTFTIQLVQASDTSMNSFGDTELRDTNAAGTLLGLLTSWDLPLWGGGFAAPTLVKD